MFKNRCDKDSKPMQKSNEDNPETNRLSILKVPFLSYNKYEGTQVVSDFEEYQISEGNECNECIKSDGKDVKMESNITTR